jgi:4-amino-4-deoxy-L-arabinose transferase-like glycosyltransferase
VFATSRKVFLNGLSSIFPDSPTPIDRRGVRIDIHQDPISLTSGPDRRDALRTDIAVYSLFAAVFVFRLIYASFLGLLPDEAYYWDWSRRLSFGYFDHPPMVAWLIAISRAVFGETILGVRFLMCTAALVASAVSYLLLKKYVSDRFALISWALLSNVVLLFGVGSMLATPDIPQVLFWSLALFAGYGAIFESHSERIPRCLLRDQRATISMFSFHRDGRFLAACCGVLQSKTSWWLLLGVFGGLGMLSKYTFALFPVSLAIFLVLSKEHRHWLGRWQLWAAAVIGFLVWSPNLAWNRGHHWLTILYQFQHGVGSHAAVHFDFLGEFVGGQIGVLSLAPAALLAYAVFLIIGKKTGTSRVSYLTTFLLVPFCFFLASSLQKRVEANWAAAAYISGLMLVPVVLQQLDIKKKPLFRRLILASIVFAAVTTAVVLVQVQKPLVHLAPQSDPAAQARGWRALARDIDAVRIRIDPARSRPVCANRYQDAALLAFYLPDHPRTFTLNFESRDNQYSLWPERRPHPQADVIFLHPVDNPRLAALCEKNFFSYGLWTKVTLDRGPHDAENWGIITGTLK